jgi:hypothetical protein
MCLSVRGDSNKYVIRIKGIQEGDYDVSLKEKMARSHSECLD